MCDGRRCSPRLAATTLVALRRLLELTLGYMATRGDAAVPGVPRATHVSARRPAAPADATSPARAARPTPSTLNKTHHITHNLTHVELAPDGLRRVEDRRVALRETAPIPVVASTNNGGHRY